MSLNFKNLNVASLDYNQIISSLKSFLKAEPTLANLDYDNKASAVNMLLNILATATAYNGVYAQLGYKESFLSTATLLSSVVGLASNSSVLLEVKKSASTTRNVLVSGVTLEAYTPFSATSTNGASLVFYNKEEMSPYEVGSITLYSGNEVVQYGNWDYNTQSMTLPLTIDPNTVNLYSVDSSGNRVLWEQVDKSNPATSNTGYYFTVLNTVNGYLVTTNLPESFVLTTDYTVYCKAVISNGAAGNDSTLSLINSYASFLTESTPSGGYDDLNVGAARSKVNFAATSQHRCVTLNDYRDAILASSITASGPSSITVQNADQPSTIKIFVSGLDENLVPTLMGYLSERSVAGINLIYSE